MYLSVSFSYFFTLSKLYHDFLMTNSTPQNSAYQPSISVRCPVNSSPSHTNAHPQTHALVIQKFHIDSLCHWHRHSHLLTQFPAHHKHCSPRHLQHRDSYEKFIPKNDFEHLYFRQNKNKTEKKKNKKTKVKKTRFFSYLKIKKINGTI